MARRGKRPEDYGQLSLFEEKEPEWLKPVDQLGYVLDADGTRSDDPFDGFPSDVADRSRSSLNPAEDADDDLIQFAEWLARKGGG